nr:expressed protein [Hymenolepis microstoma]
MTHDTINGKAPGHFVISMVTILGDGVRYIALDDISFLCLNGDTLFYHCGSAYVGPIKAAIFFSEKNDMHTYLLDVSKYGRDLAGRKRKKRNQYLYVEEYEWDAIPTSTAIEEAQQEIDAQYAILQGLGFNISESIRLPVTAVLKTILRYGAVLRASPFFLDAGKIQFNHPDLFKTSGAFLFLLQLWQDKAYYHVPKENEIIRKQDLIDAFNYEALIHGVDFFKNQLEADGWEWLQAKRRELTTYFQTRDYEYYADYNEHMQKTGDFDVWANQIILNYIIDHSNAPATKSEDYPIDPPPSTFPLETNYNPFSNVLLINLILLPPRLLP